MATNTFPKKRRLLKSREFQQVFDRVEIKQGGSHFTLLARKTVRLCSRVGIIVSKRVAKNASERNRLKRLIRETFRAGPLNQANEDKQALDILVLAKRSCEELENAALLSLLEKQWQKLHRKTNPD